MDARLPVNVSDLGSYSDLNELQKLKAPSKQGELETIEKVAAQFESMFVNLIMKTMRQANQVLGEDNPLNSQQTRFYQGMHDQQLALELSEQGGMGLQEVLVRQLSPHSAPTAAENAASSPLQQKLADRRLFTANRRSSDEYSTAVNSGAARSPQADEGQVTPLIQGLPQSLNVKSANSMSALIDSLSTVSGASIAGPESFISQLMPYAKTAAQKIGVPPQYLLAQAALETGWGKHLIGGEGENTSHNLFGIKAHRGWEGDTRSVTTHEYRQGVAIRENATFRAYPNWDSSFQDYVDFLQENPRYEKALASTAKPEQFLNELQRAGYATDPRYAEKIQQIARSPEMQEALNRVL